MRDRTVLTVLGAIAIVAIFAFVLSKFERVEVEREGVMSPEARANPVLAAERFFGKMGVPAKTVGRIAVLPPESDVVVLADAWEPRSRVEATRLLDWVRRGGRLVFAPARTSVFSGDAANDPLLDLAGVTFEKGSGKIAVIRVAFVDPDETLSVRQDGYAELGFQDDEHAAAPGIPEEVLPAAEDDEEPPLHLATRRLGKGWIAVFGDLRFLTNSDLGDQQHARLLWRLAHVGGDPGTIVLVHGGNRTHFFALLLRDGWPAWIALVALGLVAAVRSSRRFGPVLPPPPRARRSLLEHVDALGRFFWRRRSSEILVESARRAVRRRVAATRPHLRHLPVEARSRALADSAGLDPAAVASALDGPWPDDAEAFARALRTLETLRRTL